MLRIPLLIVALAVVCPSAFAGIQGDRPFSEDELDAQRRLEQEFGRLEDENGAPTITQTFPELVGIPEPVAPRPPRSRLAPGETTDAEMVGILDERRQLVSALRAARQVGDRTAMMRAASRMESLRQQALRRLRQFGRRIVPDLSTPATAPTGTETPALPLPTLPLPRRADSN